MKSKKDFFNDGFLFGKLDDYKDLFDYEMMLSMKETVISQNVYLNSQYIYEYQFHRRKISRLLKYEDLQRNIGKDTNPKNKLTDEITEKLYKELHLLNVSGIHNEDAWILGEANYSIYGNYRADIEKQQAKFINYYYNQYKDLEIEDLSSNTQLQFYDDGCRIGAHQDGNPTNRIATFLYFLNEEWDTDNGGQLIINTNTDNQNRIPDDHLELQSIVVEPTFPNFVVIDQIKGAVDNYHELKEVKSDIKLTLVSFSELGGIRR